MKALVCVKLVADPHIDGSGALRAHGPPRLAASVLDILALELALRLREAHDGEVTVLSVASRAAEAALRRTLGMGADRVVRIWDKVLEDADSFLVATALARGVRALGADLVLCGARSADTATEAVGALLAEQLDLPLVTRVFDIDFDPGARRVIAHSKIAGDERETCAVPTPAMITVEQGRREPRYGSPGWLQRMLRGRIEVLVVSDLVAERTLPARRVRMVEIGPPRPRTKIGLNVGGLSLKDKLLVMRGEKTGSRGGGPVEGSPEEAARSIKEHLENWLA